MAIPKKGSRKIIVDSVEYRWIIRHKPTYSQAAFVTDALAGVQLADNTGAILAISFPFPRCDNWLERPTEPVTPKMIEACIRAALSEGWRPGEPGVSFLYSHAPAALVESIQ
ncbi:hypothetical protein [Hahella chejuensis]|uniref:hypothetical protein n=1 Tax=Hahella chejuensis TaxID=158327 RepID=UPI00059F9800|nr:hypothetical protein [Hahella chejuensis]